MIHVRDVTTTHPNLVACVMRAGEIEYQIVLICRHVCAQKKTLRQEFKIYHTHITAQPAV